MKQNIILLRYIHDKRVEPQVLAAYIRVSPYCPNYRPYRPISPQDNLIYIYIKLYMTKYNKSLF